MTEYSQRLLINYQQDLQRQNNEQFGDEDKSTLERKYLIPQDQNDAGWWDRQWGRLSTFAAAPGDEQVKTLWKQFTTDIGENFERGLTASGYDYLIAANNSADYVATKLGLDYDERANWMAAMAEKAKQMPITATSEEWDDQLFYMAGHLFPDAVMALTGGGVAGALVKRGASAVSWGKKHADLASFIGTVFGDTATNVTTEMAHEAGRAELEGREAQYADTAQDALAMSALMSVTARSAKVLGLNRKTTAGLTGGVMFSAAKFSGADSDEAAAQSIMGAMFGFGAANGKAGAVDVLKWVKARKQMDLPITLASYVQEFRPVLYEKVFIDEVAQSKLRLESSRSDLNPRKFSPKDKLLWKMQEKSTTTTPEGDKIVDLWGYSDNDLVRHMATYVDEQGALKSPGLPIRLRAGAEHADSLRNAKMFLDAVNEQNKVWLQDHPTYKSLYNQHHKWEPRPYPTRIGAGLKRAVPESRSKDAVVPMTEDGYVARHGKKGLHLHELSQREALELFGTKNPADNTVTNKKIKEMHERNVRNAAISFIDGEKSSYPYRNALIDYNMIAEYGYIHRRNQFAQVLKNDARITDRTEDYLQTVRASKERAKVMLEFADASSKQNILDVAYKMFVASEGRLYNTLEKDPALIPARNAHMRRYLNRDKTSLVFEELDRTVFGDLDPQYRELMDSYFKMRTELDFALRRSAWPNVHKQIWPSSKNISGAEAEKILETILLKVDDRAGGRAAFLDKVEYVQKAMKDVFKEADDKKMLPKGTFDRLSDFFYLPTKLHQQLLDDTFLFKIGAKNDPSANSFKQLMDNLKKSADDEQLVDLEYLSKDYIAAFKGLIVKNDFLREMAKLEGKSDFISLTKPQRIPGAPSRPPFIEYTFIENGKPKSVWIDSNIATHIESDLSKAWDNTQRGRHLAAWLSGAHTVRLSAVGLNFFFGALTHSLDVLHLFTHHRALSSFVPKLTLDFTLYNNTRGALPFIQNFASAWKKGDLFKKYVEEDGVTATMASQITQHELIKKMRHGFVYKDTSKSMADYYNKAIEGIAKFNHVMEVATRMTEGDMLFSTGKFATKADANIESLRRINYYRRGSVLRHIDYVLPFINSTSQYLASNISEFKTAKGAARATVVMSQLVGGLALHRYFAEQDHPEFMKDVPWEARTRYWIIPTHMTRINHNTNTLEKVYIKIKKNYHPIFGILDAMAMLTMDKYLYGDIPPLSAWELAYDTIRVSTPTEVQNMIPPAFQLADIIAHNRNQGGYDIYRGKPVLPEHEINTGLTGGRETHANAIAASEKLNNTIQWTADLFGSEDVRPISPARLQESYGAYFADNPLSYFVGETILEGANTDKSMNQTRTDQALKYTKGLGANIFGTTKPGWAAYERGQKLVEKSNSREYVAVDRKIERHLMDYHLGDIKWNQLITRSIDSVGTDSDYIQTVIKRIAGNKDSLLYFRKLRDVYGEDEAMQWYGNFTWWHKMTEMKDPELRAEYYFDRWEDTPKLHKKNLERLAIIYGLYKNPQTVKYVRKLKAQSN